MKKVLVTGANGFLGQHLCKYLIEKSFLVIATNRGEARLNNNSSFVYEDVELTDKIAVQTMIAKHTPDVIVHTAAISKPDECNNNRERCLQVNVEATRFLLNSSNAFFIYISTDFIFGENGPHDETAKPDPLNFYGESKLMAERLVQTMAKNFAIVRPVFIYGKVVEGGRPTFLHWVKNNLEGGKTIKVVSDQLRTPTYVDDICFGINAIIQNESKGEFHLAGKDILSPYLMALTTARVLGLDEKLIESVTSATFPEPVKRAKHSGLKIEKARRELGFEPVSFEEGVRLTFENEEQAKQ